MTAFVDTSAWFAAAFKRDRNSARAQKLLREADGLVTTDLIIAETWLLLARRFNDDAAERFWGAIRRGAADVERVTPAEFDAAWIIGEDFRDQSFSLVDRTSFAVMERCGIHRAISFDRDFSIYRFGRDRQRAFEVLT